MTRRTASPRLAWLFVLACWSSAAPLASGASPRLNIILPHGVQRGAEHVLTFGGGSLADAQEILFYDSGFEVTKLEPNGNEVKVTVKVSPECRLGEHVAQVRTKTGISDYRVFYVGALPAVDEKEPNTDFTQPQPIAMNVTVQGVVENEDVDYFVVEAKKGERISVEVEGMRLGATLFDPYVAILDLKRFELASSDDSALALQDGFVSALAPEDGKYIVEVRESAYGGNGACRYRLHVGHYPRPTAVFPAGGKMGEEIDVRYLGLPGGDMPQKVKVPATATDDFGVFAQDERGIAPSPNLFRVSDVGNAVETEPNNELAQATAVEFPLAFNGIIQTAGDVDCFKFTAKKGQVFDVECFARRIRSGLDPVVNLYFADGRGIAGNDDARGPDSYFQWTVPEDGQYIIRVTDHLGRGRPDFVYRLEFLPIQPYLTVGIPRVERYGQYLQQIYVAKGNRFGTLITASRGNFGGELVLENTDLPQGIAMHAEPMAGNLNVMPVVFEATAEAPIAGKLSELAAHHADPNQKIRGGFFNRADFVISAPGQSLYRWRDVRKVAIAVVDELPFKIDIVEPKVPLVRNGSMQLKVVAQRKEGFKAPITVTMPFLPPGVGAASSVVIPEGQNEVLYPINANGGAELKKWRIYVQGSADVGGAAYAASQLATLEVAAPLVAFEIQRASCEQGQGAQIYCKLNQATPFEGVAKVQLLGLPPKVVAPDMEFNKETKELTFNVKTEAASPAGKHTTLFCQVTIMLNGEPIISNAGGTELQIDVPLPAPAQPAPMPAKPEVAQKTEAPPPMAKPLSRLEKLREAAKQRKEGQGGGATP